MNPLPQQVMLHCWMKCPLVLLVPFPYFHAGSCWMANCHTDGGFFSGTGLSAGILRPMDFCDHLFDSHQKVIQERL
jgi:hypothetical protein